MLNGFRLAAIDLDGTLLGPDHQISSANRAAVQRLQRAGVTCVLASGRMHESIAKFARYLGIDGPLISYNGAMVRETESPTAWLHLPLSSQSAATVIQYCVEHHQHLNFYLRNRVLMAEMSPWADFYLRQTDSPFEIVGDLNQFAHESPTKLILISAEHDMQQLYDRFAQTFGEAVYVTRTNPEYLEFMHPEANKGSALAHVAERLGIAREEVISFGDGFNDIPMLQWAGLGVAMSSGNAEAIRAADAVAPPFDEDGFAKYVNDTLFR